jgi:CRP-like cAMP-binding protein
MSKRATAPSNAKRHEFTHKMKVLAASALAQKIGYLRIEDLPDARIFDKLPTRSFEAHRIIRSNNELFLIKSGLVEIWHTHHDFMVKDLTPGALFGEMSMLGQTMLGAKAITGPPGATVAAINLDTAKEWIKTAPLSIIEKIGHRLAATEAEHYRSRFQLADSRVAAALLNLAGEGTTIEGLTHEEIGEKIGLYRETVTIVLDAMKKDRLVAIGRKKIMIIDKRALTELSEL